MVDGAGKRLQCDLVVQQSDKKIMCLRIKNTTAHMVGWFVV